MEDLIDEIQMTGKDGRLMSGTDRKSIFVGQRGDIGGNRGRGRHVLILIPQRTYEDSPVNRVVLPDFECLTEALAIGGMSKERPKRIRLVNIVGNDTGKIAGLVNG